MSAVNIDRVMEEGRLVGVTLHFSLDRKPVRAQARATAQSEGRRAPIPYRARVRLCFDADGNEATGNFGSRGGVRGAILSKLRAAGRHGLNMSQLRATRRGTRRYVVGLMLKRGYAEYVDGEG